MWRDGSKGQKDYSAVFNADRSTFYVYATSTSCVVDAPRALMLIASSHEIRRWCSRRNICGQTVVTNCKTPNGVCQVTSTASYGDGDASKLIFADYRTSLVRVCAHEIHFRHGLFPLAADHLS